MKNIDTDRLINLHTLLYENDSFNFNSYRIPVFSNLKIEFWREELNDYSDSQVCDMLEFGWPLGFQRCEEQQFEVSSGVKNHKGAREFPKEIEKYLKKELSYNAIFLDHLSVILLLMF